MSSDLNWIKSSIEYRIL